MKMVSFILILILNSEFVLALKVDKEQVLLDKLEDYELCQSRDYSGNWCDDALVRWTDSNPKDLFVAGKMTRRHMNAWGAIKFFSKAFDANQGDCKDEDVKLAVLSALALPGETYKAVVKQAFELTFKNCPKELRGDVLTETRNNDYVFQNTCKEFVKDKSIKGLKAKSCK